MNRHADHQVARPQGPEGWDDQFNLIYQIYSTYSRVNTFPLPNALTPKEKDEKDHVSMTISAFGYISVPIMATTDA